MSPVADTSEAPPERKTAEHSVENGSNGSLKAEKQSSPHYLEGTHSRLDNPVAQFNGGADERPINGRDNTNGQWRHGTPSERHHTNGVHKASDSVSEQGLGIIVEHSPNDPDHIGRLSVVDVYDGPKVKAALAELAGDLSHLSEDKEKVMKLSPEKIQALTSSPESIPYRPVGPETNDGRRVVSDNVHGSVSASQPEVPELTLQSLGEKPPPADILPKLRPAKEVLLGDASAPASPAFPRNTQNPPFRNRPQPARTVSTPGSTRRQLPFTPSNDRLTQTWASRSKQDRPALDREFKSHLIASPQLVESAMPSPLPSSIPLPPVSLPTYLQLELASGRPSPLYIHRDAASDFPYESSRVKIERLMNFIMLAPMLEQVLCFGSLACLDAWLYSFTIMPLRFIKAVYILGESWVMNVGAEIRFIWKFSMPSALLPDDKADILTGLLMIATCCVLMYFDASRMYHWIRGQAAIKLYVIYNVLEVSDRLLAAIGQDVLECLFSREALERRPDGRSKIIRPFWLFLVALVYTVSHALSLFYQVMTLNVAVNSYSNALITLLLSNQFVEIKSTVFRKFEKENLFQLTCADVVERFQLWLMLTIIASRNIVETGAFNSVNSFIPTLAQVLGPFLVVLGSEMLVDWLKHAYINKFNNNRPAIYSRFLDVLAKDYYTNAFGEQNLTRRIGLPVIPLSCLFFRVSVQTYQMFLAALLPQHPSSTANGATSLTSIHNNYGPSPIPSAPPLTFATLLPASAAHVSAFFRTLLENAIPSPAQSVHIFTGILLLTGFIVLLILKLLLGMVLLAFSRSRYRKMKGRENERRQANNQSGTESGAPRSRDFDVEGSQRVGGWGVVEVGDEKRRLIYADDPDGLRRLKEKEEKDKSKDGEFNVDHVQRYEMIAKKIW
ncbi:Pc15g02030 [Penicillium rubens Wisconsin 54-1255]|uniref:Pc15g02030 protein n=1 Tax=Penicillium rubens (strain ATCC 28089 / DSM 1075 / NRRL 1951 / Wisconsin 54-1255) TaxID=500485 RepID=B6H6D7_PENRW|nr:Pc15g02030 [Penicillium rubens Wisconsin 54-1255]